MSSGAVTRAYVIEKPVVPNTNGSRGGSAVNNAKTFENEGTEEPDAGEIDPRVKV